MRYLSALTNQVCFLSTLPESIVRFYFFNNYRECNDRGVDVKSGSGLLEQTEGDRGATVEWEREGTDRGIHGDSAGVSLRPPCVRESRAINYACPASHVVRVRPINNQWRRKVRGLSALHRRSLQRLSITKINLPRNLHSGKSDPTHPSLLGIVGKFNDFVPLVPRAAGTRKPRGSSACFRRALPRRVLLYKYS